MKLRAIYLFLIIVLLAACQTEESMFDASGTFEAVETIISAEATGKLLVFEVEEGQHLTANQMVGLVDTMALSLKKKQVEAQIAAIRSKSPNIPAQTSFYDEQLALVDIQLGNLQHEKERLMNLVAAKAAPQKQLDDLEAKISEVQHQKSIIVKQKDAQVSALRTQSNSLEKEPRPLEAQIEQIEDQLARSVINNPIAGTVLAKYAQRYEMTSIGKPLYKIADLSQITLLAYVTGDQLAEIKVNQEVRVFTDDGTDGFHEDVGRISWISSKSEFTPKTIQTKDERANLVYAIKVNLPNDGRYKIGMYGEIKFK